MIKGVKVKKLKVIPDERGRLMEILRSDDKIFKKFGQVYITTAKPAVVKAWHWHRSQTDNFTCVSGKMLLVLFDARKNSATYKQINEFEISLDNPLLVQIPPNVYHGFKCVGKTEAVAINTPTRAYNRKNPDEYRLDAFDNDIDYDWRKN
ncbi:MAG: dTDP-4-dehydrorhamnose 3,5-epimerase family protein [Candidatus Omnitrophota bacterium]